jgi:hypothetical protein
VVNYRCNIIHEQFHDGGRHSRSDQGNWTVAARKDEDDLFENVRVFLGLPFSFLRPGGFKPVFRPLLNGIQNGGFRGFLRAGYIRLLQSNLTYIPRRIKMDGLFNCLFNKTLFRNQYKAYSALPKEMRYSLVQSLFFSPESIYDDIQYEVHGEDFTQ